MPRMPKGMFKRDGRGYYVRLRAEGKDRWIALGSDYEDACRKLREVRRAGPVVASRATVSQLACEWLDKRVRVKRDAVGLVKAEGRVRLYLAPFLGLKLVGKVTRTDLWEFRRWLETHERCPSVQSVAHILSDARCFFRWCEDSGLIDRSPFPRGLMPKVPEQRPKNLHLEEVRAVLGVPDPYAFVIRLALGTGLRWGELTRAQASDLDANGVLVIGNTKSGKVRRIPLPSALLAEVRQRVGRLVPFKSPGSFARMVRRLSGVQRFHVHMLRHTYACVWMDRSGNLAALKELLGHASLTTTQRYGRISDSMVRAEVMRLDCVAGVVASSSEPPEQSVG